MPKATTELHIKLTTVSPEHLAKGANKQGELAKIKTLRCVFCDEDKQLEAFSETQIRKVFGNIYNPYAPRGRTLKAHRTCCKKCTAKQNSSLTCYICTLTKPLDQFAKAQRRKAERARCWDCIKKLQEEDPEDSEVYSSDEEEEGFGENETFWEVT